MTGFGRTAYSQQEPPQINLTYTEKQQLLDGISFHIGNITFAHHVISVNGIQIH
jgi:hypothetical protein